MTNRSSISRRKLLVVGGVGAGAATLAACGAGVTSRETGAPTAASQSESSPNPEPIARDLSDSEKVIYFSNWPQYIDVSKKKSHNAEGFYVQYRN